MAEIYWEKEDNLPPIPAGGLPPIWEMRKQRKENAGRPGFTSGGTRIGTRKDAEPNYMVSNGQTAYIQR